MKKLENLIGYIRSVLSRNVEFICDWFDKIRANVRVDFGICPECSSEPDKAPLCPVCRDYYYHHSHDPSELVKLEWLTIWNSFRA